MKIIHTLILVLFLLFLHGCSKKKFLDLHEASKNGHLPSVKVLIKNRDPNTLDTKGNAPIHYAAKLEDRELLEFLVKSGKASTDLKNQEGKTPLLIATSLAKEDNVIFLLKNGANPNIADKNRKTPLMIALEKKMNSLAKILYKYKANANVKDIENNTPLMLAARNNFTQIAKDFIDDGVDVNLEKIR